MERDLIREWDSDGFKLILWDTYRSNRRGGMGAGRTYLGYELWDNGRLIFSGEDFSGSPMNADDSDETVANLLGFLSCGKGDTDSEYFDSYTPEQLEWRDSDRREVLSMLQYDLEESCEARRRAERE